VAKKVTKGYILSDENKIRTEREFVFKQCGYPCSDSKGSAECCNMSGRSGVGRGKHKIENKI
jgi:hypothetical protein